MRRLEPWFRARFVSAPGFDAQTQARERPQQPLTRRERNVTIAFAAPLLAAGMVLPLVLHSHRSPAVWLTLSLFAGYCALTRIEFPVGAGFTVPTQLLFVPALFLLPLGWIPLFVALGWTVGKAPAHVRGEVRSDRALVSVANAWHAVGPVVVFAIAGESAPQWNHWPVYLAALAAQLLVDGGVFLMRVRLEYGLRPRAVANDLSWAYLVDVLLSPAALVVAFASATHPYAYLGVLPLAAVLRLFATERNARIDQALELGHAYRGTARLLGDVVDGDDAYTGAHSRDVVSLALSVGDSLKLDDDQRQELEFAALLHDVGKLRIPKEIIRKPGPLTDEEFALVKTHTIEGHRMLKRVGGLLERVGTIVRSCHERWDGRGYPDGLAGQDIPLASRIIFCCDAFNAMTTDRSYRNAMPVATALAELRKHSGTQFDPGLVPIVCSIVEGWDEALSELAPSAADDLVAPGDPQFASA